MEFPVTFTRKLLLHLQLYDKTIIFKCSFTAIRNAYCFEGTLQGEFSFELALHFILEFFSLLVRVTSGKLQIE